MSNDFGQLGQIFKAFADTTRREILEALRRGEQSAGDIAKMFAMTKPAISHHLAELKAAGLVVARRKGQQIIYSLRVECVRGLWADFLAKLCGEEDEPPPLKKKGEKNDYRG